MLIKKVYIKNFKAFEDNSFDLSDCTLIIGENDSGKSSILEALNIFFNFEKIEKSYVRDENVAVEIGVLLNDNSFIKKVYKPKSFKFDSDSTISNFSALADYSFVYLSPRFLDVKKLIADLAASKAEEMIDQSVKDSVFNAFSSAVEEVIDTIDEDLIVVNTSSTRLSSSQEMKLSSSIKYSITSEGIPIESRGSGYQKNLVYSLLVKSQYKNVILGIDEIENSFSLNNAISLVNIIKNKFPQSIVTTHSPAIVKCVPPESVLPLKNGISVTLGSLIPILGATGDETFVLVEGKTDMRWVKKAIDLLSVSNDFIVIQCGGHPNITPVYDELTRIGKKCIQIKDGDSGDTLNSLSKETIELYIPLDIYRSILDPLAISVPNSKTQLKSEYERLCPNKLFDGFKAEVAEMAESFLTLDSEFVQEIKIKLGV